MNTDTDADLGYTPDEALVEPGNRWAGDQTVPTQDQLLIPDPSHPDTPPPVVAAEPDMPEATAAAAGLPIVREPLLTAEAEQDFLMRWNEIQVSFVEDPRKSVEDADALIDEIATALLKAFQERRTDLAAGWLHEKPGTEELRLALRRYRSFIGVILPK